MKIKKLIKRLSEDGHMIKIRKGDVKITVYPIFPDDEAGQDPEKEDYAELEEKETQPEEKKAEAPKAAAAGPKVKKHPKTVKINHGKIMALHDAGWSIARISDELGCSIIDVSNHINGTF